MSGVLVVGIDIGTTSVKVTVLDRKSKRSLWSYGLPSDASVSSVQPPPGLNASEQDPGRIISVIQKCLLQIPVGFRVKIGWIGISGQMHGLVLWKSGYGWTRNIQSGLFLTGDSVISRLYTWQDGRCSPEFLATLPKPDSHLRLATGFGCATLFWLKRHSAKCLDEYDCAGTIQDYVVSMLCGLEKPVMSVQNAASWGYFSTEESRWNMEILSASDFPVHLLPEVKQTGITAGCTKHDWCAVPKGAVVTVAMGDLQCSILAKVFATDNRAVINISTSAQVCLQMPADFVPQSHSNKTDGHNEEMLSFEYFPYFDGQYLAVAASLNGGNVLATFVEMLQKWMSELEVNISTEQIWNILSKITEDKNDDSTGLIIEPRIYGERHEPNSRGIVRNITPFNTSLQSVYRSLCQGLAQNLCSMMPPQMLQDANATKILGCGSVLVKNKRLHKELEELYKLTIEVDEKEERDAAFGAALVAAAIPIG